MSTRQVSAAGPAAVDCLIHERHYQQALDLAVRACDGHATDEIVEAAEQFALFLAGVDGVVFNDHDWEDLHDLLIFVCLRKELFPEEYAAFAELTLKRIDG